MKRLFIGKQEYAQHYVMANGELLPNPDHWALPGGRVATTADLINFAVKTGQGHKLLSYLPGQFV